MQKSKKTYQDLTLNEAKTDSIVLAWGRFNPPTTGHEKLIKAVVSEAKKRGADYRIYPTKSTDPKKNPLTFKEKVRFMRKMFPRHARKISSDEGINTLIKAVQKLEAEGYKNLTLLAGSDRINEFKALLNRYNKKDYTFDKIDVVSAGERDPDAEDVSGMSASKMRAAASKGDFASFKKGAPNAKIAKPLYNAVRKGMKINEQFEQDGIFEYVEFLNEDDGGVVGPRFNRLLRFGLAVGGTGDIPLTKRAFRDFEKAGSNPLLRKKIFASLDRVFDYILTDEILYHRFLLLLHRKYIFGEGTGTMRFQELKYKLEEADQTSPLSTADDHPEKMNFVAKFPSSEYTNSFISDIERTGLINISWKSGDGTEVQFHVRKSTAGQEAPTSSNTVVDRMNRYSGHDTPQFGSEARIVDLVMKHGGKISRFDGDVREGLEDEPYSNEVDELLEGLLNKSWKTEIAYDILSEVYLRGLDSWEDDCNKKDLTTADQWAYSRVNSFVSGGKAQKENDADLWEEHLLREDEPLSEMDEEFLDELGKVGKVAVAGIAYHLWKKRQQKNKAKKPEEQKPETKKPGNWRSKVDWEKNEEYDINESFESEAYDMDERFEIFASEEHGAGDEATSKLRKKYMKDTPGQGCVDENIENPHMRRASNRNTFNMKLKTGPPTKEQMRKRVDREREAAEKKKKKKLKEARLTPAQRLLTKKAETQIKKDDPKAFEPGQGSKYQEPTKKHVGIIKGRLETAKRKTEGMKNKIEVQKVKQIKVKTRDKLQKEREKTRKLQMKSRGIKNEEAPPSDKAERFIKKNKESFKDKYGDRSKGVLYATAWKMHNKHWKSKE
jgi:nicotinic acid mononucleotide adenylyltransferase